MSKPSIGVVCPTYNAENFLKNTLESLLHQTQLPQKIVFVDDGSSDATVFILKSYKSKFLDLGVEVSILSGGHAGPGATRNLGLQALTTDWVAFLDCDDLWHPDKIKFCHKLMIQQPSLNAISHFEEYVRLDGRRALLKNGCRVVGVHRLFEELYKQNDFSTSAMLLRRSDFGTLLKFDENLPASQDYELWLKLAPKMQLALVAEVLGFYIERENCITAKPYLKRYLCLVRILCRYSRQAGMKLFLYRIGRVSVSRQWWFDLLRLFKKSSGHYG